MTILTFVANDKFIFRVIKHYTTNPSRQWSNSYEFVANDPGTLTDLTNVGNSVTQFEQACHNTFTVFDRLVISTWSPDSVPYNPDNFYVQELTLVGTRDTSGELEPITTCWSVARNPTSGRLGHVFYRGVLSQADTSAPSGITVLADPSTMTSLLSDAIDVSGLDSFIGIAAETNLSMAMINKTGTNTRLVAFLSSAGVTQLPVDHAWFNRTPA